MRVGSPNARASVSGNRRSWAHEKTVSRRDSGKIHGAVESRYRGSRGARHKEFDGSLLAKTWEQLRLYYKQQRPDIVDCPMSEEQFIGLLRNKGILPAE